MNDYDSQEPVPLARPLSTAPDSAAAHARPRSSIRDRLGRLRGPELADLYQFWSAERPPASQDSEARQRERLAGWMSDPALA